MSSFYEKDTSRMKGQNKAIKDPNICLMRRPLRIAAYLILVPFRNFKDVALFDNRINSGTLVTFL